MSIRFQLALVLAGLLALSAGCGQEFHEAADTSQPRARKEAVDKTAAKTEIKTVDDSGSMAAVPPSGIPRKIIYTATVDLVVKDFAEAAKQVWELVRQNEGYVDQFREDRSQGRQRSGEWTVRVPVEKFDAFLDDLGEVGIPESKQIDADDVTEEFVDLEARLANQRKFEKRLLEMLEKSTGKLPDVIAVESKLNEVRETIERIEGRLNYLQNKTSLTTVTIRAREVKDYTPPQAPSFGDRIATVWVDSLDALGRFGENLVIVAVALVPWLPLLLVVIFVPIYLIRRLVRRLFARPTS